MCDHISSSVYVQIRAVFVVVSNQRLNWEKRGPGPSICDRKVRHDLEEELDVVNAIRR